MKEKIKFSDLSNWLKAIIILMWIVVGVNILAFVVGFIIGFIQATA